MKIQINITNDKKSIKIEEDIKLNDLIITLDKLFPNKEWTEFVLEVNTVINNWSCPIYIKEIPKIIKYPWITYLENAEDTYSTYAGTTYTLNEGIYNIEI